jgi:hypothetical protein
VEVKGVVGHPVTLPCTYSTYRGITTTCWGRGQCPSSACQNTLIWTNGHRVTYQKSSRYNLKGHISEGDVSLTIENSVESDSGLYCCRVEIPGWFNDQKVTFSLQVKPGKLLCILCLYFAREWGLLFANNLIFSYDKETEGLINMLMIKHLLLIFLKT